MQLTKIELHEITRLHLQFAAGTEDAEKSKEASRSFHLLNLIFRAKAYKYATDQDYLELQELVILPLHGRIEYLKKYLYRAIENAKLLIDELDISTEAKNERYSKCGEVYVSPMNHYKEFAELMNTLNLLTLPEVVDEK